MGNHDYDVFISYSRSADLELARRLQSSLESIARPWFRRRALRVFRDETDLAAAPHLWPSIQQKLDRSHFVVLLASPEAHSSQWVNRELKHWLDKKPTESEAPVERLLIAVTNGTVAWNGSDFDWVVTDCIPRALEGWYRDEPLYVDLRQARNARRSSAAWRHPVTRLAAGVRDIPLADLIGLARRRQLAAIFAALAALVIITVLGVFGWNAWVNASSLTREKELQLTAERVLPQIRDDLNEAASIPIKDLTLTISNSGLDVTRDSVIRIELSLNELFDEPMVMLITEYREGRTWPTSYKLAERGFRNFPLGSPRIDARWLWFNREQNFEIGGEATTLHESPFRTNLTLDGSSFIPSPGIHTRHEKQVSPLKVLVQDNSHFTLTIIDRQTGALRAVPDDLDIEISAYFNDQRRSITLYKSKHTQFETNLLSGDFLRNVTNPIDKEVLLQTYLDQLKKFDWRPLVDDVLREQRKLALRRALDTDQFLSDDQRRAGAHWVYDTANVLRFRGQLIDGIQLYMKAYNTVLPLVDAKPVRFDDAELAFTTAIAPSRILLDIEASSAKHLPLDLNTLEQFGTAPSALAATFMQNDPSELAYQRWLGDALVNQAKVEVRIGKLKDAPVTLTQGIRAYRTLYERLTNADERDSYAAALTDALKLAAAANLQQLPISDWTEALSRLSAGTNRGASKAQ